MFDAVVDTSFIINLLQTKDFDQLVEYLQKKFNLIKLQEIDDELNEKEKSKDPTLSTINWNRLDFWTSLQTSPSFEVSDFTKSLVGNFKKYIVGKEEYSNKKEPDIDLLEYSIEFYNRHKYYPVMLTDDSKLFYSARSLSIPVMNSIEFYLLASLECGGRFGVLDFLKICRFDSKKHKRKDQVDNHKKFVKSIFQNMPGINSLNIPIEKLILLQSLLQEDQSYSKYAMHSIEPYRSYLDQPPDNKKMNKVFDSLHQMSGSKLKLEHLVNSMLKACEIIRNYMNSFFICYIQR